MWPLIARELRVGSRRWTSYWIRLLPPVAIMCALLVTNDSRVAQNGSEMFAHMHRIILFALWVLVPLMAADCLSAEKREGTLGLLFLTDLKAREIVLAKAFAHGLRAMSLWIAAVPLIGLPFLAGGLTWHELVASCCIALSSILFALGATIVSSASARTTNGAIVLAVLLASIAFLAHAIFVVVFTTIIVAILNLVPGEWVISATWFVEDTIRLVFDADNAWRHLSTFRGGKGVLLALALANFLAVVVFWICTGIAASILARTWRDRVKTKRRTALENTFFQPRFGMTLFRRCMRYLLDRNPVGWLELRNWTGRMAAMVWFAIMISFASSVLTYARFWDRGGAMMLNVFMVLLLVTVAYIAAASFRRERETGAMELILVTPLRERDIVMGRLRGLWLQFLPAVVIWLIVKMYVANIAVSLRLGGSGDAWNLGTTLHLVFGFIALPPIGLFFSLQCRMALLAWAGTLATYFAFPEAITRLGTSVWNQLRYGMWNTGQDWFTGREWVIAGIQAALAIGLVLRLHAKLVQRTFSFRTA